MKAFGIDASYTTTFEEGDLICHINNWNNGFYCFFNATDYDVDTYSGKNGLYIKLLIRS